MAPAGASAEEASDWGLAVALHQEDRGRLMDYWRRVLASGHKVFTRVRGGFWGSTFSFAM
jgi:hypothetical protein